VIDLKHTALFETHLSLGAKMVSFGGWNMPVEYSGIAKEHIAVRTAAGLFDVSHMGEFRIRGPEALKLIQFVTSNDAAKLVDGQAQYSALPAEDGTVVDDLLVYREAADRYMLVVNAANIASDFGWIQLHNNFDARIEDISNETSLLALQGPEALAVLQSLTEVSVSELRPFHFIRGKISSLEAIISRTGYTGEDGFELYFPAENAVTLWNAILESGRPRGILPAGLGARNTLRLEANLLLYGNDMDRTTTLLEAGLGWIVKSGKGTFIGSAALGRQKAEGVRRILAGFEMTGREIARDHYPILFDGRQVGHVTSGSPSITLKKNIGLGYVPVELAAPGTTIQISIRNKIYDARIVPTPFYKRRME